MRHRAWIPNLLEPFFFKDSETGQPVFVSEARDTVRLYGPISILSVNKEGVATLYMVHGLMKTEKPEVAAVEGAEKVEDGAEKGDKGEEGTEKDEEETERAGVTEQGQVTEEMEEMAEAQVSFGTLEQGVLTTAGEQKSRKLLAKARVA